MLLRLTRTYLRPYARPLAAVVALQLVGTIASLYLPSLNADIIYQGIATGDTNDVQQVQMLVQMTCTMLVAAPITAVGGVMSSTGRSRSRCHPFAPRLAITPRRPESSVDQPIEEPIRYCRE